jgi:L-malate glycosyltransferase
VTVRSLQVIASPRMGGAETTFVRQVHALRRAGHPVVAAVRTGSAVIAAVGDAPVRCELAMANYLDLRSVMAIRRLVREHRCDVVQSWMSRATWLTRAPRGSVHVSRLGGYYHARYFRHAHGWVTVTLGLRDWMLRKGFPADRVEYIRNFIPVLPAGTPPPFSRADLGIPEDALLVVSMGRFIDKKGYQDLIPAFVSLGAALQGRPLHLLLMGRGPQQKELESLAAPARGRVHFPGWVDQPVAALPLADVFVCPSREEAHGNVMLEAWSQRLPVLSTRTDGGSELIRDGDNGLLCEIGDAGGLRVQLHRLLTSADLRAQLAGRGLETQRTRHDESATVAAYLDFYGRLRRRFA